MRFATIFVFSAIGLGSGAAAAADVIAASAIDAVTVFPSGAEITRLAKVKLTAGDNRVILPDLPAQAIGNSVRIEGKAVGRLDIGSVDTRRLFIPEADQASVAAERKKLEAELESLRDTRAVFEGQVQASETQRKLLDSLTEMPKAGGDGTPGASKAGIDWKAILTTIGTGWAESKKVELEAQASIRQTDRKIQDAEGKLQAIAPKQVERTEVAVMLNAASATEADLVIRYQVPTASWQPLYDARLTTGTKAIPPKLDLTRRAAISQATGEPWTNVVLALSTTRPTAGSAAPALQPMTVDYVPDAPPPRPASAPAPIAGAMMEEPDGRVMKRSLRADSAPMAMATPAMEAAKPVMAAVDMGSFQAVYTVPGRTTVAPTGEAKRVQLLEEAIEPALTARTVPKSNAKAYLYAKLVLPKSAPVLPGAVSLFRDGTFVGSGRLPQLAPGEEHELGFGADDNIRVKHAIAEDKRGEKGIISASKTDTRNFKITVKNLHQRPMPVVVLDQIPVSQQQDIKVTLTSKPAPTKTDLDDKRGVLAWELKLEPDQETVIEHGYQVVWPGQKGIQYR
ncbi:MAG: mucoidy inhibitor MuiA family protein [Hyphomicrobiaceae bacterium]|nr:mucoidy inhibitor MuiA family protein [Hyphomicrobiaceae bacterium]